MLLIQGGATVEQRNLGRTGLSVSAIGFGCGSVGGLMVRGDQRDQVTAVQRALDAGITYFDTAPSYGNGVSEESLGRVMRELGARDRVVVGTKLRLAPGDLADVKGAVSASLEASLRRLQMDHVDLIQVHNQLAGSSDDGGLGAGDLVGPVVDAIRDAIAGGLARFAGFTGLGETSAILSAIESGRLDTMQSYFNALNPSAGFAGRSGGAQDFGGAIDAAASRGLGVIAIRVLAAGAVAGPERAPNAGGSGGARAGGGDFEGDVARGQRLAPLARELGLENGAELAVRFALAKPGVSTVMVGLSTLDQLDDALRWAEKGPLSASAVESVLKSL